VYVKGQYAGCLASGQPLTVATRNTLFSGAEALLLRFLPPGEGRFGQRPDWCFEFLTRFDSE